MPINTPKYIIICRIADKGVPVENVVISFGSKPVYALIIPLVSFLFSSGSGIFIGFIFGSSIDAGQSENKNTFFCRVRWPPE